MSLVPGVSELERKLDTSIALMTAILEELKKSNEWLEAIWRNE